MAVEFNDLDAPRLLVQAVDVLGHDEKGRNALLPTRDRPVTRIGLRRADLLDVRRVRLELPGPVAGSQRSHDPVGDAVGAGEDSPPPAPGQELDSLKGDIGGIPHRCHGEEVIGDARGACGPGDSVWAGEDSARVAHGAEEGYGPVQHPEASLDFDGGGRPKNIVAQLAIRINGSGTHTILVERETGYVHD